MVSKVTLLEWAVDWCDGGFEDAGDVFGAWQGVLGAGGGSVNVMREGAARSLDSEGSDCSRRDVKLFWLSKIDSRSALGVWVVSTPPPSRRLPVKSLIRFFGLDGVCSMREELPGGPRAVDNLLSSAVKPSKGEERNLRNSAAASNGNPDERWQLDESLGSSRLDIPAAALTLLESWFVSGRSDESLRPDKELFLVCTIGEALGDTHEPPSGRVICCCLGEAPEGWIVSVRALKD